MIEQLTERIRAAGRNIAELDRIKSELDQLLGPQQREAKFKLLAMVFQAKKAAAELSVGSVLAAHGLSAADARRPLYRYKLGEQVFEQLRTLLRARGRSGFSAAGQETAALFVLWGAHWFQREYRGGMRRWEDVGDALGVVLDGNDARRMVREGLARWGRKSVRGENTNQWLMTLAVEGGFPAGVLAEADGWVSRYLLRVIARLLATDSLDPDVAFLAARTEADPIPQAYQQEIFYALAADLADAIVALRRRAEESDKPRGVTSSEWLDIVEPGWRATLPIRADNEVATKLVNGLIESSTVGLSGDRAIGCERILLLKDGTWRSAVRLGLDGSLHGAVARQLGGRAERLRVFPCAAFGRFASGELAMLEPPSNADEEWRVRPSRRDTLIVGVPMSTPIAVELRCDGNAIGKSIWPKGEPVRSDLAVLGGDPLSDDLGEELSLLGSGSGNFKPKVVGVAAPPTWILEPAGSEAEVERQDSVLEDGRTLWRVRGAALIRSPEGDCFRVVSDSASSRPDQVRIEGMPPRGIQADDADLEIIAGDPSVRVIEGTRIRNPEANEIKWRNAGERSWRPLPVGRGLLDIAWLDTKAQFIRDRRRVFVLPAGAELKCRRERDAMVYSPVGFSSDALKRADDDIEVDRRDDAIVVRFVRRHGRFAKLRLHGGNSQAIAISAPFQLGAGIAAWSGVRIAGGPSLATAGNLSLSELADCVAFADGRGALLARLLDRDGQPIKGADAHWVFGDELPLLGVADTLSSMMAQFGDIDVSTELCLDGSSFWRIHQFEMSMNASGGRLTTVSGFSREDDVEIFGRPVDEPWVEQRLGLWTFAERLDRRFPDFPCDMQGTWIIYGRRGDVLVSRPMVRSFQQKADVAPGLPSAAMIADPIDRNAAIVERFKLISSGDSGAEGDLKWMVQLCASINGLPPASFDALAILAGHPIVAARVLFRAATVEVRSVVLEIARGLPFSWYLIPVEAWRSAADMERESCTSVLRELGLPDADRLGERATSETIKAIGALAPMLSVPLFAATLVAAEQSPMRRPLLDAAQDRIRRFGGEIDDRTPPENYFRSRYSWPMPVQFDRFDSHHYEALDAPCAAAFVAAKGIAVDSDTIRRIKGYERADPTYFAEAFEARLIDLLNGK